ncbi:MAG: nuclear transport factor 2 family protein [Ferruginibacter sp.]|nr:nuclear transport factor 2 family protein [Cytophagales bacterium]
MEPLEKQSLRRKIEEYIRAYNAFDVSGMVATLHPAIEFTNIAQGEVTLTTQGLDAFQAQAQRATQFFKQRQQTITDIQFAHQRAEVGIDYRGVVAVDLPNGMKTGDTLELKGRSIFRFENNQIISIEDIS